MDKCSRLTSEELEGFLANPGGGPGLSWTVDADNAHPEMTVRTTALRGMQPESVPIGALGFSATITVSFEAEGDAEEIHRVFAGVGSVSWLTDKITPTSSTELEVLIKQANNLRNADILSLSDPYCSVQFKSGNARGHDMRKTPVVDDNLNPVWNHAVLMKGYKHRDTLAMEIIDKDLVKTDDKLGLAELASELYFPWGYSGPPLLLSGAGAGGGQATLVVEVGAARNIILNLTTDVTVDFACDANLMLSARFISACDVNSQSNMFPLGEAAKEVVEDVLVGAVREYLLKARQFHVQHPDDRAQHQRKLDC